MENISKGILPPPKNLRAELFDKDVEELRGKLIGSDFKAKEYCETTAPYLAEAFTSAELAEKAAILLETTNFYRSLYNDLRARVTDYVVTSHSTFERMKMEAGFCGGEFDICTDKI